MTRATLSALLIAAIRILLLLLAGLGLTAALLLAARVGLLLTTALRIVLILLVLVRIGHDCWFLGRRAHPRTNGRRSQTFQDALGSRTERNFLKR
jgi:hypothetical protein